MQVSYKWLNEYMDLTDVSPQELADILTMGGLEVELVHDEGKAIAPLVVGQVDELTPVSGSDKLQIAQVNVGEAQAKQIVCGAPNIAEGQKVIVALAGAMLPGDFEIKPTQLMGHDSEGMICALDELGFSEAVIPKNSEDGIFVLPEDAKIGADAKPYIGLDDAVIEFDITPNRADALSVRGIAYDAAAMLNRPLHFDTVKVKENSPHTIDELLTVQVESQKDTLDYRMRLVEGVKVKESPLWLQNKLMSAGVRPIDLPVDITNYVMMEYGQPLHAFDYDKLPAKEILVRRARAGETIETLDGKVRKLDEEKLVITSDDTPVAIAGVMGGANSEITKGTQTVAIESAVFQPALTRRSAAALSLRSEASARFEKGVNMATVQEALDVAAELLAELGGGQVVQGTAHIDAPVAEAITIPITEEKMVQVLGIKLSLKEVVAILDRLRFTHELDGERLLVNIPPRRWDVKIAEDIAEEIARVYGYNNIPRTLPKMKTVPGHLTDEQLHTMRLEHYLQSVGLTQAISYVLQKEEQATQFQKESIGNKVRLMNPMSSEHEVMQQNMITGLLNNARYNRARHTHTVAQYEVGHVFYEENGEYIEPPHVGSIISAGNDASSWQGAAEPVDFYVMKGIVEGALALRKTTVPVHFEATADIAEMHPGRTAAIYLGDEYIGFVGQVHPEVAEAYDLNDTYVFELFIDRWLDAPTEATVYEEISKYPSITQDIALVVAKDVTHADIVHTIEQAAKGTHLVDIHLFDLYAGENIEAGKKSLAYSLKYTNKEATLKESEVKASVNQIIEALQNGWQAEIR